MRDFEGMPPRVAVLKRDYRGFPVPWFVEHFDGQPDFRVASSERFKQAIKQRRCWVCGGEMGRFMAFVIGPMCGITRTIADPPSHRDCAIFSAIHCPFLSRPLAVRRERDLPEGIKEPPGMAIKRNPKACGVWVTQEYEAFSPRTGGVLFRLGSPTEILWFASGRPALRSEVDESIDTGIHLLEAEAERDGEPGRVALRQERERFRRLLDKTLPTERTDNGPA